MPADVFRCVGDMIIFYAKPVRGAQNCRAMLQPNRTLFIPVNFTQRKLLHSSERRYWQLWTRNKFEKSIKKEEMKKEGRILEIATISKDLILLCV
ncbi:hypothetical protein CDAR_89101 [Caerostris darwini]|uniref:Uncharacterized protein n=1 Tax=Caerostris darwini TaxID=1538125 RepID=A0AAV4WHM0_9ARAC|nr:hypothetical protein CDAR_89101 [Caerostris darwini]